jgi:hypothetical protein
MAIFRKKETRRKRNGSGFWSGVGAFLADVFDGIFDAFD